MFMSLLAFEVVMRVSLNQLCGVIIQKDALPKSVFYFKNFIMLAVSTTRHSCDVQGDPGCGNYALRFLLSTKKEPNFQASSEKRFRIQTSSAFFIIFSLLLLYCSL